MTEVTSAARRASFRAAKRASMRVVMAARLARGRLCGNQRKSVGRIARPGSPDCAADHHDAAEADGETDEPQQRQRSDVAEASRAEQYRHEAERTGAGQQQDDAEDES